MNELDTRTLLTRMAADPAPVTTVDIDAAITTAKHQRQRTRWIAVAAAAAVVLVVTFGLVTILKPDPQRPAPLLDAPAAFDPLRPRLDVGWVPDGLTEGLWNAAVTAEFRNFDSKDQKRSVSVYAIPRTGGFPDQGGTLGASSAGPDVNGQPGTWYQVLEPDREAPFVVTEPGKSPSPSPSKSKAPPKVRTDAITLRWEYAKGGQVQVDVLGFDDPEEIATRVARSVNLEHPETLRMPLEISKPNVPVVRSGGSSEGTILEFASPGWKRPSMILGVHRRKPGDYTQKPNTTLEGKRAREELVDSIAMWAFLFDEKHEFSLQCGAADDTAAAKKANRAECRRIAASARLVGTYDDPSSWSSNPVR